MTIRIKYRRPWLYPKQQAAFFNEARLSCVEATTKAGKTVGCIAWIIEQALRGKPGSNYWWVAPVTAQARIAYTRMKAGLPRRFFTANHTDKRITLKTGQHIWFKGSDDPDSLYGEDVYAAVIDEGSRVKEPAWHAIRSTLTATRGPIRIIGNVKGRKNWFFRLCRIAEGLQASGDTSMSYHRIIAADAIEAGILDDEEVRLAKRDLPDAVFRQLYMAEPSDDEGNPFGIEAIRNCINKAFSLKPTVAWGWDLGKSVDFTVGIGLDDEGAVTQFERFQKKPWPVTIDIIKKKTGRTPALVDSTGLGDPIVDTLQIGNSNFEGFKFTGPSKQQLMEGLAVAIGSRGVSYPEGEIVLECEQFEYTFTRTGVRYSAPEGMFDDCVCALALAKRKLGDRTGINTFIKAFS